MYSIRQVGILKGILMGCRLTLDSYYRYLCALYRSGVTIESCAQKDRPKNCPPKYVRCLGCCDNPTMPGSQLPRSFGLPLYAWISRRRVVSRSGTVPFDVLSPTRTSTSSNTILRRHGCCWRLFRLTSCSHCSNGWAGWVEWLAVDLYVYSLQDKVFDIDISSVCLEGILTVLVGVVSFYLLPNNPSEVRTLTPEQKERCQKRLTLDVDLQDSEKVSWRAIASAFTTLHIWLQVFQLFCSGCSLFGLAYFTPSLVRALGYGPTTTQLLTVPPFALAFIVSVIVASISDRTRQRGFSAISTWSLALVGLIMFYKTRTTGARYTALFFMITGVYSTAPSLVAWVPNNTAAHTRRATAIAMAFMSTNIGGIVCTWIFPTSDAPYYTFGSKFLLSLVAIAMALGMVSIVLYRRLNSEKDDPEFRQRILQPILGLGYGEQLQILGDSHPDFRYTY